MDIDSEKKQENILGSQVKISDYSIKKMINIKLKYKKISHVPSKTFKYFIIGLLFILIIQNNLIFKRRKKINKKQNVIKYLNNEKKEGKKQVNKKRKKFKENDKSKISNIANDWEKEKIIIHALGKFKKQIYTNSFEALNFWYYKKNMHFMEADCHLTSDNHVVLSHDYRHLKKTPTLSVFKKSYAKGNLTSMTFEDLVVFMEKHPDLYIITDTKFDDIPHIEVEFDEMTEILSHHKNVNKRFIIEVYNEKMFLFLKEHKYPFKYFMFTLYKRWRGKNYEDLENIFSFCSKHNIKGIIMYKYLFNNKIYNLSKKYSVPIYLHTENSIIKIAEYLQKVKGIFTDYFDKYALEEYLSIHNKLLL